MDLGGDEDTTAWEVFFLFSYFGSAMNLMDM